MKSVKYFLSNIVKEEFGTLEFRKSLGWIFVMLQGLLVAFNLKQLSLFHYHRAQWFLIYSLNDRDSGTKYAFRFRPYLIDHVIMSVPFFLSFCTSVYTFLREKTDDVFILNNLMVEQAIWKGDVS